MYTVIKFAAIAVLLGSINTAIAANPKSPTDQSFPGYQGALAAQWSCLYNDNVTAVSKFGGGTYIVRQGNKVKQILNRGSTTENFNPDKYDLVDVNYYIKDYKGTGQNCDPNIHELVWISKEFKFTTKDSVDSFTNQPNPCIAPTTTSCSSLD